MSIGTTVGVFSPGFLGRANLGILADIIAAILPEDMLDEVPQGYTQVGHVGEFVRSGIALRF